jgi:hypothetical protein
LNSNKLTGLAVGSAATDSASLGQVQAEAFIWCGTMTGSADAGVLTPSPAITAYAAGQRFVWMASSNVNTGAMTVAVSGLSTIAAQNDGSALAAGDHAANKMYMGVLNTTSTIQIMRVSASTGLSNVVDDTSPQLGGALDPNSHFIGLAKGGDITSASPLVIDTDGDHFDVTGTTGFAAMTVAANRHFYLQFDGVLTMTYHASNLDLPSEASITTAAGDVAEFLSTGANTVQCVNYTKADGTAVVSAGGPSQATQAALEAETNEDTYAAPDLIKYSPGVVKWYIQFNGQGTPSIGASYNVTSLTDNGTGDYTVTIATDFSSAYWPSAGMCDEGGLDDDEGIVVVHYSSGRAAGTLRFSTVDVHYNADHIDFTDVSVFGLGEQS